MARVRQARGSTYKSAFEYARRKSRLPLQLKRVEGPLEVDGPAYGALMAGAARVDDVEFIVLAKDVDDLVELWKRLGIEPDDVKRYAKRVAIVEAKKVKRA